jgi:hypothetical protein
MLFAGAQWTAALSVLWRPESGQSRRGIQLPRMRPDTGALSCTRLVLGYRRAVHSEWVMLTCMILASLAHGATSPATAFNAAFYSTVATVIPVLFLAIAVQGRGFEDLLKAFTGAYGRWMTPGQWLRALPAGAIGVIAAVAAFAILLFGAVGEIIAIYALYQQQARSSTAQSVLAAVAFMVLMTAARPILAYGRIVATPLVRDNKWIFSRHGDTEAEPESAKASETVEFPQPCGKTEPDETGAESTGC